MSIIFVMLFFSLVYNNKKKKQETMFTSRVSLYIFFAVVFLVSKHVRYADLMYSPRCGKCMCVRVCVEGDGVCALVRACV